MMSEVPTEVLTSSVCLAPIWRATATLEPVAIPIKKVVKSVPSIPHAPTEPTALSSTITPSTVISMTASSAVATFISMMGHIRRIRPQKTEPSSIFGFVFSPMAMPHLEITKRFGNIIYFCPAAVKRGKQKRR